MVMILGNTILSRGTFHGSRSGWSVIRKRSENVVRRHSRQVASRRPTSGWRATRPGIEHDRYGSLVAPFPSLDAACEVTLSGCVTGRAVADEVLFVPGRIRPEVEHHMTLQECKWREFNGLSRWSMC